MGRSLFLGAPPRRIISLVPSQTQLLADLGLEEQVVGLTRFCVHPKSWHDSKPRVGGTKDVRIDRIKALRPDLIIGNKEENVREQIEALEREYPVWMSDIRTLDDAFAMIRSIGKMTDRAEMAGAIAKGIGEQFGRLEDEVRQGPVFSTLYLIWRKPWMAAGTDTFIDTMLALAGLPNVVKKQRYPVLSPEEIRGLNPDVVLLSSEPYPFKTSHIDELQALLPGARKILCVDGEPFSWYGSRLVDSPAYFSDLQKKIEYPAER